MLRGGKENGLEKGRKASPSLRPRAPGERNRSLLVKKREALRQRRGKKSATGRLLKRGEPACLYRRRISFSWGKKSSPGMVRRRKKGKEPGQIEALGAALVHAGRGSRP